MAQGRRKKGSGVNYSRSIGGRPGPRSVFEVSGYDRMAGAAPSEQRSNQFRGSRRPKHLTGKVAGFDNPDPRGDDKTRGEKQRKSDLKRIREIRRRQRAQAQIEKAKQGKTGRGVAGRAASTGQGRYSAVIGMGPSQGTTGGGLGMLAQQDRSKPKKMNMGGVMKARGGTFKGVF